MSFSSEVKKQIVEKELTGHCCQRAAFLALTKTSGTLDIRGTDGVSLALVTENPNAAKMIVRLSRALFDIPGQLSVCRKVGLKNNNRYEIRIPYQLEVKSMLYDLGMMDHEGHWIDFSGNQLRPSVIEKTCCKRAYLIGAFLGGGSVNNPETSYHLEFVSRTKEHGELLAGIMAEFAIHARICCRKERYVVYLKNAEQIGDLLIQLGAHQGYLTFESDRVVKDMNNLLNRQANFDMANIQKMVNCGVDQVRAIEKIKRVKGLDSLTPALREAAELRLEHTNLSLSELGAMADPPVGKSGMNHRLKKLTEMAKNL